MPNPEIKKFLQKYHWQKIAVAKQCYLFASFWPESFSNWTSRQLKIDFNFKNQKFIENSFELTSEEMEKFGKAIYKKTQRGNISIERQLRLLLLKYNQELNKWLRKTKEVKKLSLHNYSNKRLAQALLNYIVQGEQKVKCFGVLPIQGEDILKQELVEIISQKLNLPSNHRKVNEIISKISEVIRGGYVLKERRSLARLINHFKELTKRAKWAVFVSRTEPKSKNLRRFNQLLMQHINSFGWMNTRNYYGHPWNKKDILNRIKSSVNHNLKREIKNIELKEKQSNKEYKKILKIFKDKKIERLADILRQYIFFRTFNRDTLTIAQRNNRPILGTIARRLKISYDELIYFSYQEIIRALNKSSFLNRKIGRERARDYAFLMKDGKLYIFVEKGLQYLKSLTKLSFFKNITEIHGTIANKGFARGLVKIVKIVDEIKKVRKGDILVAPATFANYLPAMEKSAAFVTDIGGLTSHAAIVARELNLPCIVGTKNASQVLKDGDLVEVDADRGIVKILK